MQQTLLGKRPSLIGNDEIEEMFIGNQLAVSDLEEAKKVFDQAIISKKYDVLTSVVWEFKKTINFAASGYTALTKDLNGKQIQDIMNHDIPMKQVFFTIFPERDKSYCILSWLS